MELSLITNHTPLLHCLQHKFILSVLHVCQVMSVKDGYVDSPWWALADVTNSPLGVTSLPADDVAASESDRVSEVLDLSQRQTVTAASTSFDDLTAGRRSNSTWCDVNDDADDGDDDEQHTMTSLSRRAPFMKRSCIGERFATASLIKTVL